jgi:hypothetical protein
MMETLSFETVGTALRKCGDPGVPFKGKCDFLENGTSGPPGEGMAV